MAEALVEDDSSYPTSITVPEDGDARNAASVVVAFQGLANRFAHWKTKFVDALLNGGTITMTDNVFLLGKRLILTDLTVQQGYATLQQLLKTKVYASGANPSDPTLNPILFNAVWFEAASIAADTTLVFDDSADTLPVGYSCYVKNEAGFVVYVGVSTLANGTLIPANLSASANESAWLVKVGPSNWKVLINGKML